MASPLCPATGTPMVRGMKQLTITYKGKSITFKMPGWYSQSSEEGIHSGKEMKVSDHMLNRLKAGRNSSYPKKASFKPIRGRRPRRRRTSSIPQKGEGRSSSISCIKQRAGFARSSTTNFRDSKRTFGIPRQRSQAHRLACFRMSRES